MCAPTVSTQVTVQSGAEIWQQSALGRRATRANKPIHQTSWERNMEEKSGAQRGLCLW